MGAPEPICRHCGKSMSVTNDYRGPTWVHYRSRTEFDCGNPTRPQAPEGYEPRTDMERQAMERH